VERGLQKAGLRLGGLRIIMELDSTEAIISCVEEGLGIGFVSEWAMARRAATGSLATLRLNGTSMTRSFSFITPRIPELPAPTAAMLRFLLNRAPAIPHNKN
jgi:DNA-binding transcriptional LysR family regulator